MFFDEKSTEKLIRLLRLNFEINTLVNVLHRNRAVPQKTIVSIFTRSIISGLRLPKFTFRSELINCSNTSFKRIKLRLWKTRNLTLYMKAYPQGSLRFLKPYILG